MNIKLEETQIRQLLDYLDVFHKWNQVYNLSAIRDPMAMVRLHLLDSLALVPYLQAVCCQGRGAFHVIDVGTGGGLPGVPLAISCPQVTFTLLDSSEKKTHFLFQTGVKLALDNLIIENNRVESFSPASKFAIVVSRAFASLDNMVRLSSHLLAEDGEYWAMKGNHPETEIAAITGVRLKAAYPLKIPGVDAARHLIILKKFND